MIFSPTEIANKSRSKLFSYFPQEISKINGFCFNLNCNLNETLQRKCSFKVQTSTGKIKKILKIEGRSFHSNNGGCNAYNMCLILGRNGC